MTRCTDLSISIYKIISVIAFLVACTYTLPCQAAPQPHTTQVQLDYTAFLTKVASERVALGNHDLTKARQQLFRIFNNDIPYYWQGTGWDFNGTTRHPQQGNVACGYFITNVLTDLGFRIARVKLAQQASSVMIKELTTNIHRFTSVPALTAFLSKQPGSGVFIIGLDFHTGFIVKDGDRLYFLHSNYINRQGVIKETLGTSAALNASHSFYVGNLLGNDRLIQKWLER